MSWKNWPSWVKFWLKLAVVYVVVIGILKFILEFLIIKNHYVLSLSVLYNLRGILSALRIILVFGVGSFIVYGIIITLLIVFVISSREYKSKLKEKEETKTGWKNWPYNIKRTFVGGCISVVISLVLLILVVIILRSHSDVIINTFHLPFNFLEEHFVRGYIDTTELPAVLFYPLSYIVINIIIYPFIIGALIGWIYRKIKSKSKRK